MMLSSDAVQVLDEMFQAGKPVLREIDGLALVYEPCRSFKAAHRDAYPTQGEINSLVRDALKVGLLLHKHPMLKEVIDRKGRKWMVAEWTLETIKL